MYKREIANNFNTINGKEDTADFWINQAQLTLQEQLAKVPIRGLYLASQDFSKVQVQIPVRLIVIKSQLYSTEDHQIPLYHCV